MSAGMGTLESDRWAVKTRGARLWGRLGLDDPVWALPYGAGRVRRGRDLEVLGRACSCQPIHCPDDSRRLAHRLGGTSTRSAQNAQNADREFSKRGPGVLKTRTGSSQNAKTRAQTRFTPPGTPTRSSQNADREFSKRGTSTERSRERVSRIGEHTFLGFAS